VCYIICERPHRLRRSHTSVAVSSCCCSWRSVEEPVDELSYVLRAVFDVLLGVAWEWNVRVSLQKRRVERHYEVAVVLAQCVAKLRVGDRKRLLDAMYVLHLPIEALQTHTQDYPYLSGIGSHNLDFTEARDSEWQWHQLGHMQVCTLLQIDNHASTPPLSFWQAECPLTNSVKAPKAWNPADNEQKWSLSYDVMAEFIMVIF